ncbi:MAG: hypothetical protein HY271_04945 [Deltaproteobacteria bacterium]|nr:hypothetical protein [Deltaproteobacteria bacterium]
MSVAIAPAHDVPPGIITAGQVRANPISETARSSAPPQRLSSPPHALQSFCRNFVSIVAKVALVGASGQASVLLPRSTRSWH